jgi:hypothetical protein
MKILVTCIVLFIVITILIKYFRVLDFLQFWKSLFWIILLFSMGFEFLYLIYGT